MIGYLVVIGVLLGIIVALVVARFRREDRARRWCVQYGHDRTGWLDYRQAQACIRCEEKIE